MSDLLSVAGLVDDTWATRECVNVLCVMVLTWCILCVYSVLMSSKAVPQFTDALVQLLLDEHSVSIHFVLVFFVVFCACSMFLNTSTK